MGVRISQDRRGQLVQPPRFTDEKARAQRTDLPRVTNLSVRARLELISSKSKPRDLPAMQPMVILPVVYYRTHEPFRTL